MTSKRIGGLSRPDLAVLGLLVVLGLLLLPAPFTGDQALYAVGGDVLRSGGSMYGDFWDIKQPGIYLYFAVATVLPGPDEVAVHLVDLVGLLVLAVLVRRVADHLVEPLWLRRVAPLLVVGTYLAGARPSDLSQVELVVGLPLLASLWLALGTPAAGRYRTAALVASGALGATVVVFKIVYLPIPLAFWLLAARRDRKALVPAAAGATAVIGVVVAWFAATGVLHEVWYVYFDYSRGTTASAGRPVSRLVGWGTYAPAVFSLTGPLALVGVWRSIRERRDDPVVLALLFWLVGGLGLVLVQHWWAYHLMLFIVPVGLLAVVGIDALRLVAPRRLALAAVIVLAVPGLVALAGRAGHLATHDLGVTPAARDVYHAEEEPAYATAADFARFAGRDSAAPGDVYVLANPLVQLGSDRDPAIAINGWSPEQYDVEVWARLGDQLLAADPPYIVIDEASRPYLDERNPALAAELAERYCEVDVESLQVLARLDTADCARTG